MTVWEYYDKKELKKEIAALIEREGRNEDFASKYDGWQYFVDTVISAHDGWRQVISGAEIFHDETLDEDDEYLLEYWDDIDNTASSWADEIKKECEIPEPFTVFFGHCEGDSSWGLMLYADYDEWKKYVEKERIR